MCHDEKATNTGERDKERGEKEKRREKKGTINDARKRNYPLNFKLETYVLNSLRRGNLLMVNSTNTVKYHVYDHRRDSCDHGRIWIESGDIKDRERAAPGCVRLLWRYSLRQPLPSPGRLGPQPPQTPSQPPSAVCLGNWEPWSKQPDQANRECDTVTPALGHKEHLTQRENKVWHDFKWLIFDRLLNNIGKAKAAWYTSHLPDLAVFGSSDAPTAPWTTTSPSDRHRSNSSSGFTESEQHT